MSITSHTITFIRHGQATHNPFFDTGTFDWSRSEDFFDAPLTEKGLEQARSCRIEPMDLVVVSPLTRTLQTATEIFKDHSGSWVVHADARECFFNGIACNRRHPLSIQKEKFPHLTFGSEAGEDNDDRAVVENMKTFTERIDRFVDWLKARSESKIAVVSHGNFLEHLIKYKIGEEVHLVNCGVYVWSVPANI